jgi:hypothetical protein
MRELTHKLTCAQGRWSCECGYVLGRDGHQKLYAPCPKFGRKKALTKFNQSFRRSKTKIKKEAADLFDLPP